MKVGMIGLGKLGLPVSIALSFKHEIFGYDVYPNLMKKRKYEHREVGPKLLDNFQDYFDDSNINFVPFKEVIDQSEIIFVSVQTPHHPKYEGTIRAPSETKDFDYQYLVKTAHDIAKYVSTEKIVVIISTVLPGTIRREVLPILSNKCKVVYNPFFIAMGTVLNDYLNPEFVLLGSDDNDALQRIKDFYIDFYGKDLSSCMSIESAELCKVYYNTFITAKITLANTLMEMCQKIPNTNCDDIVDTISKATNRIISNKYLRGGMGDGGACHGRDLIAMSNLSERLNLSFDTYKFLIKARESQTEWLADLMISYGYSLPKVIIGKAFKAETNILTGSPSVLLSNILDEKGIEHSSWDPYIDGGDFNFQKSVFLIGTKHECFKRIKFPVGSIVLDPHRYINKQDGVRVIPIGIRSKGD